jgi:hypothetical protein
MHRPRRATPPIRRSACPRRRPARIHVVLARNGARRQREAQEPRHARCLQDSSHHLHVDPGRPMAPPQMPTSRLPPPPDNRSFPQQGHRQRSRNLRLGGQALGGVDGSPCGRLWSAAEAEARRLLCVLLLQRHRMPAQATDLVRRGDVGWAERGRSDHMFVCASSRLPVAGLRTTRAPAISPPGCYPRSVRMRRSRRPADARRQSSNTRARTLNQG